MLEEMDMKKEYLLYLLILILPLIVNGLMFIPVRVAISDNVVWIGFFGSYLGGVVSGFLTLFGVRLTIQENNEKDFMDSLPEKLMYLEELIFVLERQRDLLSKIYKEEESASTRNPKYRDRIKYILEYLENDGLLKQSAKVNVTTYRATRRLYNALKKIQYVKGPVILPYEDINQGVETTINTLKIECDKFLKRIEI